MADSTPIKRVEYRDCPYYIAHLDEKTEEDVTPGPGDTAAEE